MARIRKKASDLLSSDVCELKAHVSKLYFSFKFMTHFQAITWDDRIDMHGQAPIK